MTPERLAEIREAARYAPTEWDGFGRCTMHRLELLSYVDELTRQLEDARDIAIQSGAYTIPENDESGYTHELNDGQCEHCGGDTGPCGGLIQCVECGLFINKPAAP